MLQTQSGDNKFFFDYIIIGQGICGTFLSYYLYKAGKKILVIDDNAPSTPSKIASGIINPVTGRRVVSTWMIDELMQFAEKAYNEIGNCIGKNIISKKNIIAFPASVQMREAYNKRLAELNSFVHHYSANESELHNYFNFVFGVVEIKPVLFIELFDLLLGWKRILQQQHFLLNEKFLDEHLVIEDDFVQYKNFKAGKFFFCNGVNAFLNPLWKNLPYIFNKGEALIVDIPQLLNKEIYKFGNSTLTPWNDGLWWLGSSYENEYETELPTAFFLEKKKAELKAFLKSDFKIIDHFAALRPAVVERRPFAGFHPLHNNVGILNGMGTKGCSLAPYFANELVENIINNQTLNPLVDVKRFLRALSKL